MEDPAPYGNKPETQPQAEPTAKRIGFWGWVGRLVGLIALLVALDGVLDWRIRSVVEAPAYRASVARMVRPAMVFDSEGRVLSDSGVRRLLECGPEIEFSDSFEDDFLAKIRIRPKGFLAVEPILEALDSGFVAITPTRIVDTGYEFKILSRTRLLELDGETEETRIADEMPMRFRLELVPPGVFSIWSE